MEQEVVDQAQYFLQEFLAIPVAGVDKLEKVAHEAHRILCHQEISLRDQERLMETVELFSTYAEASQAFVPQYGETLKEQYREMGRYFTNQRRIDTSFIQQRDLYKARWAATENAEIIYPKHIRGLHHTATFLTARRLASRTLGERVQALERKYWDIYWDLRRQQVRRDGIAVLQRVFRFRE